MDGPRPRAGLDAVGTTTVGPRTKGPVDVNANTFADITEYLDVYGMRAPLDSRRLPGFKRQVDLDQGFPPNWFLGPRAENFELFVELLVEALDSNASFRKSFHPEDGIVISERVRADPRYLQGVDTLRQALGELLAGLRHDTTPYYSWRYQGHMLWDTTLASMLGYVATMLHNPNNVTIQASTLTTFLEQLVGWDLCGMLGFPFPDLGAGPSASEAVPHGHLTSGGTVANLEATWSARELKFLPVATKGALTSVDSPLYWYSPRQKDRIRVRTAAGVLTPVHRLDDWALLNIPQDETLGLPSQIHSLGPPILPGDRAQLRWRLQDVWDVLGSNSVNTLGLAGFYQTFLSGERHSPIGSPVVIGPVTWHYSWPKASAVLGGGTGSAMLVRVDARGRMDLEDLRRQLNRARAARSPVILVVAVLGSTEESAVDDLTGVLAIRDEYRREGLDFNLHVDGAWGGYFASMLRRDFEDPGADNRHPGSAGATDDPFLDPDAYEYRRGAGDVGEWVVSRRGDPNDVVSQPAYPVFASRYVVDQLRAIRRADSATVDPHKTGYVPYPAGSICYRNGEIRRLVTFGAPVIGSGENAISVGEFGVEGSKPGAAAAAVYLSHAVARPAHPGHGQLMNAALVNAKLFYLGILGLNGRRVGELPQRDYVAVPLADLVLTDGEGWSRDPVSGGVRSDYDAWLRGGGDDCLDRIGETAQVASRVIGPAAGHETAAFSGYEWFRDVGPDLNVVDYVFNFRPQPGGPVNRDLKLLNHFNQAVYDRLHVPEGLIQGGSVVRAVEVHDLPLMVSKTDIWRETYGDTFVIPYLERLGVTAWGPGRRGVVDVLGTMATGASDDPRELEEQSMDCYRRLVMMRSVVMNPFLHDPTTNGRFFVDAWMDVVHEVVTEVVAEFRRPGFAPPVSCDG